MKVGVMAPALSRALWSKISNLNRRTSNFSGFRFVLSLLKSSSQSSSSLSRSYSTNSPISALAPLPRM
uniref:Epl101 n=1 Tax=Arundo donax TaxID=35708 RepID=A0A0A9CV43_ARUDO